MVKPKDTAFLEKRETYRKGSRVEDPKPGSPLASSSDKEKADFPVKSLIAASALAVAVYSVGFSGLDFVALLDGVVEKVSAMGPVGYLYFAGVYILAEVLALPAFPLTASSGYLFGLVPGFLIVLASATIAAGISFLLGRNLLKEPVQRWASTTLGDKWTMIDSAVEREGFKVVLLLRLSPLLPFALSNYLYGITSVDYVEFMVATFLGFSPGTFGIVYAGTVGKNLFSGIGQLPWYAYASIGIGVFLGANLISRFASDALSGKIKS